MSNVALAATMLAGSVAQSPAPPPDLPAHTPQVTALLEKAVEAARTLHAISYDARMEASAGEKKRIVTGTVRLDRFEYTDFIGGRVSVTGQIVTEQMQVKGFELAYDGLTVQRYVEDSGVVLEADAGYGGEALMLGNFGSLIVLNLIAAEPYTAERVVRSVSLLGQQDVDGHAVDVLELATDDGKTIRWYLDAETHLPRRRDQSFQSTGGHAVETTLALSNIRLDPELDPSLFRIETPEGAHVERMGRKPPAPFELGDPAPDWGELVDADGKAHRLSDYAGQVLVLDFWSTWCPHCNDAMPSVQVLHQKYAGRGATIIGMNCRERSAVDPVQYVHDKGHDYLVLDGNGIAPLYRVGGIPAFYVIGPDGKLLFKGAGFSPTTEAMLDSLIEKNLPK